MCVIEIVVQSRVVRCPMPRGLVWLVPKILGLYVVPSLSILTHLNDRKELWVVMAGRKDSIGTPNSEGCQETIYGGNRSEGRRIGFDSLWYMCPEALIP